MCICEGKRATDYYGAIRNTPEQLFGRKSAERTKRIKEEARDPNTVVRHSIWRKKNDNYRRN